MVVLAANYPWSMGRRSTTISLWESRVQANSKNLAPIYNNEIYDSLYELLEKNTPGQLVHQGWQVFKLNYEDNDTKYLITHVYSTEPPIPDITTTDASYINQFIVTPYDRSKDFGARRPFGFKVGYSYNVKHGNMCKYPINKPTGD